MEPLVLIPIFLLILLIVALTKIGRKAARKADVPGMKPVDTDAARRRPMPPGTPRRVQ